MPANIDTKVVEDFGREWGQYDQIQFDTKSEEAFLQYFSLFPKEFLNTHSIGFDAGCGSGRWARYIAPRVKHLYCFDPSEKALNVAKRNLSLVDNCSFECASINDCSIVNETMDFGYCIGVLHHLPDTKAGMSDCVSKLKKGAPFLLYIYYKFENRPLWFVFIWKCTDFMRRVICRLPFKLKLMLTRLIALFVYFPLARVSLLFEYIGIDVSNIPLSDYRRKTFYFMSIDALDRFGTTLEKRFTKKEISSMMEECGLISIEFGRNSPYWVAIGFKQ